MADKDIYRKFCKKEDCLPIFMKDWWLDAVCGGDNWDVAIYMKDDEILGVLPFPFKKKLFFRNIIRPQLTPWLGPWLRHPNGQSESDKIKFEQKVHFSLLEKLPYFDWFNLDCQPEFKNWKAFYWKGFKQTTKYTSVLEKTCDEGDYFQGLEKITRKRIRKATERYIISNDYDFLSVKDFFRRPFERQGLKYGLTDEFLKDLFEICEKESCMEIFIAKNKATGILEAVNFCIWDTKYYYLLLSGGNDLSRINYANYLLTYSAIKSAWDRGLIFNFEGSMMSSIDSFMNSTMSIVCNY